jgi:hypothetical protein
MKMSIRLNDGNITFSFDTSKMDNQVEMDSDTPIFQKYWNMWGESEAKGFFRHLANSVRKRCRDGNWHKKPTPFNFSHSFSSTSLTPVTGVVSVIEG